MMVMMRLQEQLSARLKAKFARDFTTADLIRDQLRDVAAGCGCLIWMDDQARTYRFSIKGGRSGGGAEAGGRGRGRELTEHDYRRSDSDGLFSVDGDAVVLPESEQARVDVLRALMIY
jgi:hypothetical protein